MFKKIYDAPKWKSYIITSHDKARRFIRDLVGDEESPFIFMPTNTAKYKKYFDVPPAQKMYAVAIYYKTEPERTYYADVIFSNETKSEKNTVFVHPGKKFNNFNELLAFVYDFRASINDELKLMDMHKWYIGNSEWRKWLGILEKRREEDMEHEL